jgi:hypothetical protein
MGKRLLFILLILPFCIFIGVISVVSFFVWIIRGKGLIDIINWAGIQMNKLSR